MATFRKRESGRWQAIVRRGDERMSRTFSTRARAQAWAKAQEADIEDMIASGMSSRLTVRELFEEYEVATRGIRACSASKLYSFRVVADALGDVPVQALTKDHVIQFATVRRAAGAAPPTIAIDLSIFVEAVATMRDIKGYPISPTAILDARSVLHRLGVVGKAKERKRRVSDDELAAIVERGAGSQSIDWNALAWFALASAMRLSEITSLRWADLRPDDRLVMVRDRKDPGGTEGNNQWVPLTDATGHDALAIVLRQPREGEHIFPYSASTVSTVFPRMVRAAGIEDLRFHDLRHEACTRMLESGLAIQEVALISGHKEWKTLQRYVHLRPEAVARKFASPRAA